MILNLSPEAAIDYATFNRMGDRAKMTGEWLAHCSACPVPEIGNTNSRYRFSIGARRFTNDWNAQGPAHHCAIGIGHIAHKIGKLGKLIGIETVKVC